MYEFFLPIFCEVKTKIFILMFIYFCLDGLVGMAIVGGIGLGVAGLAGLIGLAVSKGAAKS